jgi:hypothetical protein
VERNASPPSLARTLLVVVLAVAAAVVVDVLVSRVAVASGVPAFSPAGNTRQVARLSATFCAIGALVFLAIRYLVRWRPRLAWRIVAYCAMVVSFSPDLRMLGGAWANLPNLPGFPGFGGAGGPPPGGFRRGNGTFNASNVSTSGGFRGLDRGQAVAFLVAMLALAAIVLTEALARWGMPREA